MMQDLQQKFSKIQEMIDSGDKEMINLAIVIAKENNCLHLYNPIRIVSQWINSSDENVMDDAVQLFHDMKGTHEHYRYLVNNVRMQDGTFINYRRQRFLDIFKSLL